MSSNLRVQSYLDKHKITPLFEDLMNKVVHDMPDEPILYIIKLLYKKASKPIPEDLKFAAMRKSTTDLNRSRSPEAVRKSRLTQSTTQIHTHKTSPDKSPTRALSKPWPSDGRVSKTKRSPSDLEKGAKAKTRLSARNATSIRQSSLDEFLIVTPIPTAGETRKSRPDWNNDVRNVSIIEPKTRATSSPERRQTGHAWASIGLDSEENLYSSGHYTGPRTETIDPLLNELSLISLADNKSHDTPQKTSHKRNKRLSAEQHKQQLSNILSGQRESTPCDSGIDEDTSSAHDDAIEMLEDADDLLAEGVTKVPASGYRLSKIMRERKAESEVKLNINLYPRSRPTRSPPIAGTRYGELPDFDDDSDLDERPSTGMKLDQGDSDEDFESVSQVTGPRQPVWNDVSSEVAVGRPRHTPPAADIRRTIDMPLRALSPEEPRVWNQKLSMSSPSAAHLVKSLDRDDSLDDSRKVNQGGDAELGVYHEGNRGWMPSEGSEVSAKPWRDLRKY